MDIVNNELYYSNKQLEKIIDKMNLKCNPDKIIICESKIDLFKKLKEMCFAMAMCILLDLSVWICKIEGSYYEPFNTIIIYVFSQNYKEYNFQSKQLYSLHSLAHEMRHLWQERNHFKGDKERDADEFATNFINSNSKYISKIMNWDDEWEVEEE